VSGRPGRGAPNDPDDPQARTDTEAAAAATAIAIAGLRRRLRRQSTLEHPAVRHELRQLDEQLAAQLERAARTPGRHRFPAGSRPGRPEPGHGNHTYQSGLRPDPAAARTAAQLITMLGQSTAASTTGHATAPGPQPAPAPSLHLVAGT
jgi:hypothetical protein